MVLEFYYLVFCVIVVKVFGELNYESNLEKSIRNHEVQRLESLHPMQVLSPSSPNFQTLSMQQQLVTFQVYYSNHCNNNNLMSYYFGELFGDCNKNGTSSFSESFTIQSNGNLTIEASIYNNTQCNGTPSKDIAKTGSNCMSSNNNSVSLKSYSVTNSIPPLPGGILFR